MEWNVLNEKAKAKIPIANFRFQIIAGGGKAEFLFER